MFGLVFFTVHQCTVKKYCMYFSLFVDEMSYTTAVQFLIRQKWFLQVASTGKLLEV